MSKEKLALAEEIFARSVIKEKCSLGHYELLIARTCDPTLIPPLKAQIETQGIEWFQDSLKNGETHSRRQVYIPVVENNGVVVIKKKDQKLDPKADPRLKVGYFTQSIVHEFRTSYLLLELMQHLDLPKTVEHKGESYRVIYDVQVPLAAIVDLDDPSQRYTIFEYIPAFSARDDVNLNGGWFYTSEETRKLFGQFNQLLLQIAPQLIPYGLEPWDLGVHQLLYEVNETQKTVYLGIIDTEEYNFAPALRNFLA